MQDHEIIALYFARDEQALVETANKYGAYLYKIAQNIVYTPEDSEECVNDTYLNTWRAIPPRKPDIFRLFLAKIVRSLSINRYNMLHAAKRGGGQTAAVLDELEEVVGGSSNPEQEFIAGELGRSIDAFVRSLPEREANVFVRRYFFTDSTEDIAAQFGISKGNVAVILHRTREKLRTHLEKEGMLS